MTSMIRSVVAAGLFAGAFAIATPHDALAQKGGNKGKSEQKSEKKAEKRSDKQVTKTTRHNTTRRDVNARRRTTSGSTYRGGILCEDGTVFRTSIACAGHGGVAARQGPPGGYPRASDRARERANENSAVVRGIGNNVRNNAIARCADGTYWHANTRDNACYGHGGVATWY
jgi:hypothetical protein